MKQWLRLFAITIAVATLAGFAAPALAQDLKVEDGEEPVPMAGPNCDVTGYKGEVRVFSPPLAIPDNNASGVTIPIPGLPADGDIVNDVILGLNMSHTWLGDLIMTLTYDPDCTGPAAAVSSTVLCRPGRTVSCGATGSGLGCSSNFVLDNTITFSDEAVTSIPSSGCLSANNVPAGCYLPTGLGASPFSNFRGLPKGGCWFLTVSDNAGLDLGTIAQVGLFVRNQRPVPAVPATWGGLKSTYR